MFEQCGIDPTLLLMEHGVLSLSQCLFLQPLFVLHFEELFLVSEHQLSLLVVVPRVGCHVAVAGGTLLQLRQVTLLQFCRGNVLALDLQGVKRMRKGGLAWGQAVLSGLQVLD
jgi:hypothetical protein